MTTSALMVCPKSDLPLAFAEAQDIIRSGLQITPIFSPVGQVVLTREIKQSQHEGLFLIGHMDAQGNFELDNGELLSASALTSLVRGRYRWVYLNTCQSIVAAQGLQNETGADIIATIIDIPDADAYRTGSLFASALAKTGDTRQAYDDSLPGNNRAYVYLGGNKNRFLAPRTATT